MILVAVAFHLFAAKFPHASISTSHICPCAGSSYYFVGPMFSILVVDDNAPFRALLKMALGSKYAVVEAENGAEGLRAVETNPPFAVVISDMNMPGMSGIQFLA